MGERCAVWLLAHTLSLTMVLAGGHMLRHCPFSPPVPLLAHLSFCPPFVYPSARLFAEHLLCVGRGGGHWQNQLHVPAFWGAACAPTVSARWPCVDTLAWIQNFAHSQVSRLCLRSSVSLTDQSTCRLLDVFHPSRHRGAAAERRPRYRLFQPHAFHWLRVAQHAESSVTFA